jgi:hypothetical protein
MTKEQQKIVDKFHERSISLLMKRNRDMKYSTNPQKVFEDITEEIYKVEDERRAYEKSLKESK